MAKTPKMKAGGSRVSKGSPPAMGMSGYSKPAKPSDRGMSMPARNMGGGEMPFMKGRGGKSKR